MGNAQARRIEKDPGVPKTQAQAHRIKGFCLKNNWF